MSDAQEQNFEKQMARLQEIVAALESDDLPLEQGMALYREGMACSRFCRERLEKARHELELWQDGQAAPCSADDAGAAADAADAGEKE
ncbi:Exodeoxyribonuclease VII small subunit [Desulfovibrio legallii]|uniref:Exodeoxyribonuclease 7 small subunit n=2 Tax=Desulfovibrio legallii TaxID=571438 RepID=A0A1G7I5C1_9BACT|nr:Exodeoxyribonuclease VII small subunit [Desulfovibrio legallii]